MSFLAPDTIAPPLTTPDRDGAEPWTVYAEHADGRIRECEVIGEHAALALGEQFVMAGFDTACWPTDSTSS